MSSRLMILVDNRNGFFPNNANGIIVKELYLQQIDSKIIRGLRKIHLRLPLPFKNIWFTDFYKDLNNCDAVCLFDTGNAPEIIKYIKKKYPEKRIILWYWGPVEITVNPSLVDRTLCEIWSFDLRDCKDYGLMYNTQFFFAENVKNCFQSKSPIIDNIDVCFVGTEKNRLEIIKSCALLFDKTNISYYFHVVKSKSHYTSEDGYPYKNEINYLQTLRIITKSKAVLDIVASDQTGMTLRPLEALFFKKKLITNDKNIANWDLYNSNNVYIIGVDDERKLSGFLNSPYDMSNYQELTQKYCVQSWAKRFFE